jgi:hypothetical protein
MKLTNSILIISSNQISDPVTLKLVVRHSTEQNQLFLKMKKLLPYVLLLFVFQSNAQELPYTFSVFNEPYIDLVNPTSINNGEIWDDPEYMVPVGFNFDFMGQAMTQIGIIYPGAQLIPVVAGDLVNVFLIYQSDIIDIGVIPDSSLSPMSYRLEGEVGTRILKIEWKNVGFYSEFENNGTTFNTTNFQLWLYETTNDIEYRFGPNTIKSPDLIHFLGKPVVGLGKNVTLDGSNFDAIWLLDGDPVNPSIYTLTYDQGKPSPGMLLDAEPPSGTVYHFDTGIVGVDELTSEVPMQIYPTLADVEINLIWGGEFPATCEIHDATGKLVNSVQISNAFETIDISALATGCYVLRTNDGLHAMSERFVVE